MTPPDMTPPVPTLEEMAKLEAKATAGPWVRWKGNSSVYCGRVSENRPGIIRGKGLEQIAECDCDGTKRPKSDASFIAASRAFVPWAIARIAQLEAEAAKWNKAWHEQRVTTGEAYWVGERVSAGELLERIFFLEKENGELKAELRDLLVDAPSVDAWNEGGAE